MAKKFKFAMDAGHGMKTAGKGVPGLKEHEFNSAVVQKAKELAEYNGFEVILTQDLFSDYDRPLAERSKIAITNKVDVLISFHADANENKSVRGHWCFYWKGHTPSQKLAKIWDKYADMLLNQTADRNYVESVRGTWTDFHMVREPVQQANIPSILAEHAFMTNPDDLKLLLSDDFRSRCAEVAVRTACEFLNVPFTELSKKPKEEKTLRKFYRVQVGSFQKRGNANNLKAKLLSQGYDAFVVPATVNGAQYYRVQVGSFTVKANAEKLLNELKRKGYGPYITEVYL